jgi:hypothetical protein
VRQLEFLDGVAWSQKYATSIFQALLHYTQMKRIIHPLLMLIARATEKDLALYIEYLKAENKILRSKLPKRVEVTAVEKATLTKLGVRLGSAIKNLITIVHPRTFARWLADTKAGAMRLRELEVLERVATSGKLNVVLGEKGLAERVVNLL